MASLSDPCPAGHEGEKGQRAGLLWLLLALAAVGLWISRLTSGLWLDETVTAWVIGGGFGEILHRSIHFQSSPVYYFLPWLAVELGGRTEAMLRLPSLLAAAGSCWMLYLLGARLRDRETGAVAALIFASISYVAFAASDARPYSVALFTVIAAMYSLHRWLERGGWRDAVAYVLLASLTVYLQLLFAVMFLVHLIMILRHRNRYDTGRPVPRIQALGLGVSILICLLPFYPQLESLLSRRHMLSFAIEPTLAAFLRPTFKLSLCLLLGWGVARLMGSRVRWNAGGGLWKEAWAPLLWGALPPALLWMVSLGSPHQLFVTRYYLCAVPGGALLLAILLRRLEPASTRSVIAATTIAGLMLLAWSRLEPGPSWREVIEVARSHLRDTSTPVMVATGLIEERQMEWFGDPLRRTYLLAPLSFYPIDADVTPLPRSFATEQATRILDDAVRDRLRQSDRFLLIEPYGFSVRDALVDRLRPHGYRYRTAGRAGMLYLFIFERDGRGSGEVALRSPTSRAASRVSHGSRRY